MKYIYIAAGFIFLALGIIGIALPVLPTTPFLLVTAFCFAKGSKRFNNWFRSTGIYKKYLETFLRERSMPLKAKLTIMIYAGAVIAASFYFVDIIYVRIFLVCLLLLKYYFFIFYIKTSRANPPAPAVIKPEKTLPCK